MATVHRRTSGTVDRQEGKNLLSEDDDDDEPKTKLDQWLNFALIKLQALLWIVLGGAVIMYTDLFGLVVSGHSTKDPSKQINRFWFNVALAGFGGWCLVALYLIVYYKYILKMPGDWEQAWPQGIPIATACAVASLIAFCVAFWPVWTWLTIPFIFLLFMGILNTLIFLSPLLP